MLSICIDSSYCIQLGGPVYSLAWSSRKGQLVAGQRNCIRLLSQAGKLCVCVFVCVFVCVYVCMFVYVCVCMHEG